MHYSLKISNLILRLSLACIFFWYGVDWLIHPTEWLESSMKVTYLGGALMSLIGISFLTNIFVEIFSAIAFILVLIVLVTGGVENLVIERVAVAGSLLALSFWPRYRKLF